MCHYFQHYGAEKGHNNTKDLCFAHQSTVEGLLIRNAYTAVEDVVYTVDNYKGWTIDGGGVMYKFTATKDGVYRLQSLGNNVEADPAIFIHDAEGNNLVGQDDDLAYDNFLKPYGKHFCTEIYLTAGTTIYAQCSAMFHGDPQIYEFKISYIGEQYDRLIYCTTGDGAYSYNQFGLYYLGIDVAFDSSRKSSDTA